MKSRLSGGKVRQHYYIAFILRRGAIINISSFNNVEVRDCNVGYATFVDKELGSNACHMEMPFQGLRKSVVNIF